MTNASRKAPECDCCGQKRPCVDGPYESVCCTETFACHVCLGRDECDECDECPVCGEVNGPLSDATEHSMQFNLPVCRECRRKAIYDLDGPQSAAEAQGDA